MKQAPQYLQKSTRAWINGLLRTYEFEQRHTRILVLAGGCWDKLQEIRDILDRDGYTVLDRFGQAKAHPLLAEERNQKKLFAQLIRELGLDLEAAAVPRVMPTHRNACQARCAVIPKS